MKELGIYIHIPFCKKKCRYCDFISYSNKDTCIENYIEALKNEITSTAKEIKDYNISTIYIGGGTPSYIESKYIVEILKTVKNNFNICKKSEITIELNPGTVSKNKLQDYFNEGINRLSIGLQETNDNLLSIIGRIHTYEEFLDTYFLARKVGFKNINIDLMIGLPEQTLEDIKCSLEKIIKLNPEHISVYSLIVEEGTQIEKMLTDGKLKLPSEKLEREEYWYVKEKLENARI